jgi:Zn-dependent protease with chaperone function
MDSRPPPDVRSGRFGPNKFARHGLALLFAGVLSACGTTYEVPKAGDAEVARAKEIFAEESNPKTAKSGAQLSEARAAAQYRRVVARVEPVAEAFCKKQTAEKPAFDCDVRIAVDDKMPERNAYQTIKDGKPIIAFSIPFIRDARNEDELAFVLGHEFGHHIGQHIHKQEQQAIAGALILGAITAVGQGYATQANPYRSTAYDQAEMQRSVELGMAAGQAAFSQTYELESDMIGTYIAKAAGYDPVKGARFFARPEAKKSQTGKLSFWGTHPPDQKRLATVIATVAKMKADSELTAK